MPFKKPSIATYDLETSAADELKHYFMDVFQGSFGDKIEAGSGSTLPIVPYEKFPLNFHEYDIHIVDMNNQGVSKYNQKEHFIRTVTTIENNKYYLCTSPVTHFDPAPLSASIFSNRLSNINKENLVIIFAGPHEKCSYLTSLNKSELYDNYAYLNFIKILNLSGKEVLVANPKSHLGQILTKNVVNFKYECTFYLPQKTNGSLAEGFEILMQNSNNDVIAFSYTFNKTTFYVLPNYDGSISEFLNSFILDYCPTRHSAIFPEISTAKWINNEHYFVPNEKTLLSELNELRVKYENDKIKKEKEIQANRLEHQFLIDLITETGDALVFAVKQFLEFLGFTSVKLVDHTNPSGLLEEDIQIELDKGYLLVIEVKGINGTSKDSECAQINKVKNRRMRERNSFNVFGLYIVNHQRSREPLSRLNPPFNEIQINDALNDERGLISTWELFKAYNYIIDGLMTKNYVKDKLVEFGLIRLAPDKIKNIGEVKKTYSNGLVSIFELTGRLDTNDLIYFIDNDKFESATIESIQVEDKNIESVDSGEIGIKTSKKLREGMELFTKV